MGPSIASIQSDLKRVSARANALRMGSSGPEIQALAGVLADLAEATNALAGQVNLLKNKT